MTSRFDTVFLPLIKSDLVTDATQRALLKRLDQQSENYSPSFFAEEEFSMLEKICARLVGESSENTAMNAAAQAIPRRIDERLAHKQSDGWRYDTLPSDGEAYRVGLRLLLEAAATVCSEPLLKLDDATIDQLLSQAQCGEMNIGEPDKFDYPRWFEELLAEAVEIYYSHPESLQEIGYVGFADAPGWQHVGLNDLEPRETTGNEEAQ